MKKALVINSTIKRDISIDAARGVALFLVAVSHALQLPHYLTDFYIITFFFISGWLYKPGKHYGFYIKKKAERVLIPYIINSFILLLSFVILFHLSGDGLNNSLYSIFYSRYTIFLDAEPMMNRICNSPLWYLTAFFSTSLLFHAVVDRFTNSLEQVFILFVVLISATIALVRIPFLLPWSFDMVPFFTVAMITGYLFRRHRVDINFTWPIELIILTGYIALCFANGPVNMSIRQIGTGGGKFYDCRDIGNNAMRQLL